MESAVFGGVTAEAYLIGPGFARPVPRHVHDAYQVQLSPTGVCRHTYRGAEWEVPPFQIGVVHPGESHSSPPHPVLETPSMYQVLYLAPEVVNGCRASEAPYVEHHVRDERLPALFHAVFGAVTGAEITSRLEKDARVLRLAQGLVRCAGVRADEQTGRLALRRARDYLHDRAADEIPLATLAAVAGVSVSYLCRAFRRETGLSPCRYQYLVRVERAKSLLARGVPPGEAAVAAGFTHQSHLGVHFKRVLGVTPGQYARACAPAAPRKRASSSP